MALFLCRLAELNTCDPIPRLSPLSEGRGAGRGNPYESECGANPGLFFWGLPRGGGWI
jgi:hypothetical protein